MPRWLVITLGIVAVLATGGTVAFQNYWYYLPGIYAQITNPVQANHEVVWQKGPETATVPAAGRPPNIILIVADDLGYNDITVNGGGIANGAVPTPNINSIAHDGANLTDSYAGNATCAPSRAAMMTGRYATRFGFEFTSTAIQFQQLIAHSAANATHPAIYHSEREKDVPDRRQQIVPTSEIMLPQLLKGKGYRTMMLGKWHLGETQESRPEARGFDEFVGFLYGGSRYLDSSDPNVVESRQDFDPIDKFIWANLPFAVSTNNQTTRFTPSKYMTDYLAEEAAKAIGANKNRPFFLYVAFNAPHTPLQALKSDFDALPGIADHRLRVYGAMVRALDRGVGTVLQAVKANGIDDNTLVIFTSDNGGAHYIGLPEINKPFRGWKATFFEGGIRVPLFLRWPAKIKPGTTFAGAVGHVDIFATAAAAAGAEMPADRKMDGVNLVPYVSGTVQGTPHQTLFWRSGDYRVLLAGDWKLQVSENPKRKRLYNLKDDPTEKNNLADAQADRLAELSIALDKLNAEQHAPLWPSLLEGAIAIDHPMGMPETKDEDYIYWAN